MTKVSIFLIFFGFFRPKASVIDLPKEKNHYVKFDKKTKKWQLFTENKQTKYSFSYEDLRVSIAYRMRCFENGKKFSSKICLKMFLKCKTFSFCEK